MRLPEGDPQASQTASPLLHQTSDVLGSLADIEQGPHGLNGPTATGTVPAGRGAQEFGARSSAPKDVRDHVKSVIEQNKELVQPSVVRGLLLTYALTVVVVAVLSIAGQVAVNVYINNSRSDAVVINVSGRQRMLSQLILKDVLAIHFLASNPSNSSPPHSFFLNELQTLVPLWIASQEALINGTGSTGPLTGPPSSSNVTGNASSDIGSLPWIPGTGDSRILAVAEQQAPHFNAMVLATEAILRLPSLKNFSNGSADYQ